MALEQRLFRIANACDYPHYEGTDDPIDRFEKTMADVSEEKRKFILIILRNIMKHLMSENSIRYFSSGGQSFLFFII